VLKLSLLDDLQQNVSELVPSVTYSVKSKNSQEWNYPCSICSDIITKKTPSYKSDERWCTNMKNRKEQACGKNIRGQNIQGPSICQQDHADLLLWSQGPLLLDFKEPEMSINAQ
jgi:hypothetical protein